MNGVRFKRLLTGLLTALGLLATGPLALAAKEDYSQSLLKPAGPQAKELFSALTFDVGAILILMILLMFMVLYVIVKYRQRAEDPGLPAQVDGNPRLEFGWTVALILGLMVLAWHPAKAEFVFEDLKAPKTLDLEVIGHQWWWEVKYPNEGIVTANEIHIPTGAKVRITTTSVDVIHALGVPRLGGKNDSFPGRVTKFWIQADEPGIYQGQCWELCGASHGRMLARVIAHDPADFEAWVQARKNPVTTPEGDLAVAGEQAFMTTCAACHTVDGTGAKGTVGPNLTAFGTRTSIGGGVLENTPENLGKWLADPASVKPGAKMPNLGLGADTIAALTAYLEGLK